MSEPTTIDPELITAIKEHRGTYDGYDRALDDAASLGGVLDRTKRRAAEAQASSLLSDMAVRCNRLTIDIDCFLAIMAEDAEIRKKSKRNPTLRQLGLVLEARDGDLRRRAKETDFAAKRAAFLAKDAADAAATIRQARLAITGYAS